MIRKNTRRLLPVIVLLGITLALFGTHLFSSHVIGSTYWDTDVSYYLKLRDYAFGQDGPVPRWNTLDMCGVPLVAEIQSGLFYPPNIVFLFVPLERAVNITILLHVFLLAAFTYSLARQMTLSRHGSLIAAVTMSLCGPVTLAIFAGHLSNLYTITWIPLLFLLIARAYGKPRVGTFILLGVAFALQFLAGHTQYFYYSILFSAVFVLFRAFPFLKRGQFKTWALSLIAFISALFLALILVLPQLLPVLEMLSLSARTQLAYEDVAQFSFPVENLLTLFAPTIFGDMSDVEYWGVYNLWEMCVYVGVLPLFLSAVSLLILKPKRYVVFFACTAVVALIIGLGDHTPIFRACYRILPGFDMFRGHSKILIMFCFSMAMLAGAGFDALVGMQLVKSRRLTVYTLSASFCLLALLLLIHFSSAFESWIVRMFQVATSSPARYLPVPDLTVPEHARDVIALACRSASVSVVTLLIGVTIFFAFKRLGSNTILKCAVVTSICLEMLLFARKFILPADDPSWRLTPGVTQFLQKDKHPYRLLILSSRDRAAGAVSHAQQISGDYPYALNRYSQFYNQVNHGQAVASMKIGPVRKVAPVYSLLNVKYVIADSGTGDFLKDHDIVYDDGRYAIYENPKALDRAFPVHNAKIARTDAEALKYLSEPATISGLQFILEADVPDEYLGTNGSGSSSSTVEITEYRTDVVRMTAYMHQTGWVVLSDSFYPGWEAVIGESTSTDIFVANYLFRAIRLPAGTHEITFRYTPTHSSMANVIALTAIALIVFFFGLGFLRSRRQVA